VSNELQIVVYFGKLQTSTYLKKLLFSYISANKLKMH